MTIKNVGVIGCGLMGSGIAQVAAQAGFPVLFVEASAELVGVRSRSEKEGRHGFARVRRPFRAGGSGPDIRDRRSAPDRCCRASRSRGTPARP